LVGWLQARFPELVKAGEKVSVKAIGKQLGEEWKAMTAEQKKVCG
jgi:hypothetical protein